LYPTDAAAGPVLERMARLATFLANGKEKTDPEQFDSLKKQATRLADAAEQNAADAKTTLEGIQSALKGCDTKSANDLVEQISSHFTSAEIEIGAGADLRRKAQACEQPDPGLDKQIRNAAAVIHALADQCRFQDAFNFANKIPEQYRSLTLIQNELARARIGAQAIANLQQALRQSQLAAQRGDRTQAEQFFKQAQWEANNDQRWYHCAAPLLQGAPTLPSAPSVPAVGGLVLIKTEVRPGHNEVAGVGNLKSHFSNSSTSAEIVYTEFTGDMSKLVQRIQTHFDYGMKFSGTSGVLRPGDTLTVNIYGTESRTPMNTGGAYGVTATVHQAGLQPVSQKPCWVGAGFNDGYHATCTGEFVFKVPPNTDKVTLSFNGNFGINDAATYTWEKPR